MNTLHVRGRLPLLLAAALALGAAGDDAQARIYQWVDPTTGSVQMSGIPPAWYRSTEDEGPRTFVYENGNVIDDTAIPVDPEQSGALREAAFQQFEEAKQLEALKRLERDALKQAEREEHLREFEELEAGESEDVEAVGPQDLTEKTIEQLKELIEQFDRFNIGEESSL